MKIFRKNKKPDLEDSEVVPKENLFLFFGNKNCQGNHDNYQGNENIYVSHNVVNIHDFDKDTLKVQQLIAKANPRNNTGQLNKPLIIGPINTDPNDTWPISRNISDTASDFRENNSIHNKYS